MQTVQITIGNIWRPSAHEYVHDDKRHTVNDAWRTLPEQYVQAPTAFIDKPVDAVVRVFVVIVVRAVHICSSEESMLGTQQMC